MTDSADDRPFTHVKHLREIRDRIGKELEHMTADDIQQWRLSQEYTDPTLRRLMSEVKSPKTLQSENGAARALDLMPYPKYKPSGVEWLGDVPEHWEVKPLQRVLSRIDNKHDVEDSIGKPLHVGMDSVESWTGRLLETPVPHSADRNSSFAPFLAGDILFGKLRPYLAKACRPDADGLCSSEFIVLRERNPSSYASYLLYALLTPGFIDNVNLRTSGARMPRASWNWIGNLRLPLPTPSESCAIVLYLDRETAKIDALIRQKEILVERLDEHRTVLVSRTVTRGLPPDEARKAGFDPHPKLKPSGVEWLGDVPEHWEVKPLGTFGDFFKGSGGTRNDRSTTGVPCIRYGDIYTMYDRHVRTPFGFVSEQVSEGYTQVLYGDVLFAGSGETLDDIGKSVTTLLREHTCCSGDVIVFRPNFGALNPVFSGYALDCAHASWQKSCMGRGVTVMHIYASGLKHLVIPLPLRQEQEAIGAFLDRETAKIDRAAELARREMELLREYRTRLISDVVTGKVDVRGIAGTNIETAA